jgi:hypothetical protein
MAAAISVTMKRGTGTLRDRCDFGVPRTTRPPTSENARRTSILRRPRSMSHTRRAVASPQRRCRPGPGSRAAPLRGTATPRADHKIRPDHRHGRAGTALCYLPRLRLSSSRPPCLGRPPGVAARSATPNLDTVATHKGSAPMRKNGEVQVSVDLASCGSPASTYQVGVTAQLACLLYVGQLLIMLM